MAKVHFVKKARKDNPCCKKGESYYWWQFAFMKKQYSKTKPTRSQTTRSPFYQTIYDIEDSEIPSIHEPEDVENVISIIQDLRDETESSLYNMPDSLREADTGMLLQERIDALEEWIDELESIADTYSDIDEDDDEREDKLKDFRQEISECCFSL